MAAERVYERRADAAGREFADKFCNMLCELRLQPGTHARIVRTLNEFAEEHPRIRAGYLSREVDESYFSDGACGWEASARPRLQGVALEEGKLFEFLAFSNGLQVHSTSLDAVVDIEELWLEIAPDQPFAMRVTLYHSFPATTVLVASEADGQEAASSFVRRLKYLRGF